MKTPTEALLDQLEDWYMEIIVNRAAIETYRSIGKPEEKDCLKNVVGIVGSIIDSSPQRPSFYMNEFLQYKKKVLEEESNPTECMRILSEHLPRP